MFQVREHYTKVSHWVKGEFQIDVRASAAASGFGGPFRDDWDGWAAFLTPTLAAVAFSALLVDLWLEYSTPACESVRLSTGESLGDGEAYPFHFTRRNLVYRLLLPVLRNLQRSTGPCR